jgi:hypothetical protein
LLLANGAFPERDATVMGAALLYLMVALILPLPFERRGRS